MNDEVHVEAPVTDTPQPKKPMFGIKTAVAIVIIIILMAIAYFYRGFFIAATVNGNVISRWAIIKNLERQAGASVLDSLITEELIREEAKNKGIAITDADVDAEIKNIEDGISAQGTTLDAALSAQGMSREQLRDQIRIQKTMELLLGTKLDVPDIEIDEFITANNMNVPAGEESAFRAQVRDELRSQKFSKEAGALVDGLRSNASITQWVRY